MLPKSPLFLLLLSVASTIEAVETFKKRTFEEAVAEFQEYAPQSRMNTQLSDTINIPSNVAVNQDVDTIRKTVSYSVQIETAIGGDVHVWAEKESSKYHCGTSITIPANEAGPFSLLDSRRDAKECRELFHVLKHCYELGRDRHERRF